MTTASGCIREMGVLDLTSAKTPEDLEGISSIEEVGIVLIPENLRLALTRLNMSEVGTIVSVPQGGNVRFFNGQTQLTGEALAAGPSDSILIVAGQLFITTPVQKVGFKEMRMTGQLFAPRGSETALGASLAELTGQVFYYPEGARFIMGQSSMSHEFLDALPGPTAFVIMGHLSIDSDVHPELLKTKVTEFMLYGRISAATHLTPLVQALTPHQYGTIESV